MNIQRGDVLIVLPDVGKAGRVPESRAGIALIPLAAGGIRRDSRTEPGPARSAAAALFDQAATSPRRSDGARPHSFLPTRT